MKHILLVLFIFSNICAMEQNSTDSNTSQAGFLTKFTKLEALKISASSAGTLPMGYLNGLTRLQRLQLDSMRTAPVELFTGLINLKTLSFPDNKLSESNKEELRKALPNVKITFENLKQHSAKGRL